jgi:hypothetical protein
VDEWLKNIYSKNKFLFWVVVPFVSIFLLLTMGRNLISKLIVSASNEELSNSKIADATLKEKESGAKSAASEHQVASEAIDNKIKSIEKDEDWNKKRKGSSDPSVLFVIFSLGVFYIIFKVLSK